MGKRFIDTDFLKNDFVRGLSPEGKNIWLWLILSVDIGGFIHLQFDSIRYQCNLNLTDAEIIDIMRNEFKDRISWAKDNKDTRIWIRKYLFYQGNFPLHPFNPVHKLIIENLLKNVLHYRHDNHFKYIYKVCCVDKFIDENGEFIRFHDKETAKSIVNTQRIYKQKFDLDNVPEIKLPDEDLISVPVSGSKKLSDLGKKD